MVIWLIGLSGSGKTTVGKILIEALKTSIGEHWEFVDGDYVRAAGFENFGHTIEGREKNGKKIQGICQELDAKKTNVLACVLSLFPGQQKENRSLFTDYKQIYLKADIEDLEKRDNKNLYAAAIEGKIQNVVGVDIPFPEPVNSDLVLVNKGDRPVYELSDEILSHLQFDVSKLYRYTERNLFKNREKYQYTKFYGPSFLASFAKTRNDFIVSMDQKTSAQPLLTSLTDLLPELCKKSESMEFELETYLAKSILNSSDDKNVLWILIKKFEVYKRLFTHYSFKNNKMFKATETYEKPALYALFSLWLSHEHTLSKSKDQKLIIENCLLKVNDLVVSIHSDLISPEDIFLAKRAVVAEQQILQKQHASHFAHMS